VKNDVFITGIPELKLMMFVIAVTFFAAVKSISFVIEPGFELELVPPWLLSA